jgi:hypothetical protein
MDAKSVVIPAGTVITFASGLKPPTISAPIVAESGLVCKAPAGRLPIAASECTTCGRVRRTCDKVDH